MGRKLAGKWQELGRQVGRNSVVQLGALYNLKIWRFARYIRQILKFFWCCGSAAGALPERRPGGRRGAAKSAICSIGVIQIWSNTASPTGGRPYLSRGADHGRPHAVFLVLPERWPSAPGAPARRNARGRSLNFFSPPTPLRLATLRLTVVQHGEPRGRPY